MIPISNMTLLPETGVIYRKPPGRSRRPLTNPFFASEANLLEYPIDSPLNRWPWRAPQGTLIVAARQYLFSPLRVKLSCENGMHLFHRYSRPSPFERRPVKRSGQVFLSSVSARRWLGGQAAVAGLRTFGVDLIGCWRSTWKSQIARAAVRIQNGLGCYNQAVHILHKLAALGQMQH